jgi:hypothetical protein
VDKQGEGQAGTEVSGSVPAVPVVLLDVASQPLPATPDATPPPAEVPGAGEGLLEEALPEITEAARKVGGFKRLSEIAAELDRGGTGQ